MKSSLISLFQNKQKKKEMTWSLIFFQTNLLFWKRLPSRHKDWVQRRRVSLDPRHPPTLYTSPSQLCRRGKEMSYQRAPQQPYPPPGYPPPPGFPSAPPPPYEGYPPPPPPYDGYPPPPPPPPPHGYPGYQGYFSEGYPPPPPQQYQHCHHEHYQNQDPGCTSFLQACLAGLCCCCMVEECCF